MDNSTTVQYNVVKDGVNKIEDTANKMDSIFNDFDQSMGKMLNPEVFAGIAADEVGSDYQTLKNQFADFIALVRQFAEEYRKAANIMQSHETTLQHKAEGVNEYLTKM